MSNQGVTPPTVIVATEHERVVRFYAGHAGNGGMHQTGQFTITRDVDPTELANMAVDLSASFGWLQVQPVAEVPKLYANVPPAIVALPAPANGGKWKGKVMCPVEGCGHITKRSNMYGHLQSGKHGWSRVRTSIAIKDLPELEAPPEPAPKPAPGKRMGNGNRHGVAGTRELHGSVFPRIIKIMQGYVNPVTSTTIAKRLGSRTDTTRKWMLTLVERGDLVIANEATRTRVDAYTFALASREAPPIVETAPPAINVTTTHTESVDSTTAPMYDAGSQPTERNEPA